MRPTKAIGVRRLGPEHQQLDARVAGGRRAADGDEQERRIVIVAGLLQQSGQHLGVLALGGRDQVRVELVRPPRHLRRQFDLRRQME